MGYALIATAVVGLWGGPRPTLSGAEELRDTADGRFRFHFTRAGVDAVDDDEILAWAEAGLARVWSEFVDTDGWPAPAADDGAGGDARLDIYVRVLDANGYAHAQPATGGTSCWMELDPGIAGVGEPTFASIAGHELHHCLQFAVTTAVDGWIYEATSTYAQYLLYGDDATLALARDVLWRLRLAASEEALDVTDAQLEYGAMVWVKYLVDRGGGERGALLALWDAMAAAGDWEAGHAAALPDAFGIPTLLDGAAELAEWQWFACDRDDGAHWADDPARCVVAADVRPADATPLPASGVAEVDGRFGSAYVHVPRDCATADVAIEVTPDAAMRVQVLGGPAIQVADLAAGEPATFAVADWNRAGDVVIIGTAVDGAATFAWSVDASGAGECDEPEPEPEPEAPAGCGCRGGEGDASALLTLVLASAAWLASRGLSRRSAR